MDTRTSQFNSQILEEATAWFIDFNEDEVGPAEREEFNTWLRRSPQHVQAFLQISALWEDSGTLSKCPDLDIDNLIARAKGEHNIHPLFADALISAKAEGQERPLSRRVWLATAASVAVTLSIGAFGWQSLFSATTYETEVGEQRSITLEDGSSVELNSRSRIRVRYTDAERTVELVEGQALFSVAKNPARPFIVATGDTRVRAVGTQFDVYRKPAGTVVTVIEGRVAVTNHLAANDKQQKSLLSDRVPAPTDHPSLVVDNSEVLLAAGQQLTVTPLAIEIPKPANIPVATAWTDKRLVFESTPLREVVEEFNRYNRQQLVIRDADLYDYHISGIFPSTDPSRMVEFLRQRFGVTLDESRNEIEISRSESTDPIG